MAVLSEDSTEFGPTPQSPAPSYRSEVLTPKSTNTDFSYEEDDEHIGSTLISSPPVAIGM